MMYFEAGATEKLTIKIIVPYKFLSGESSTMANSKQTLNGVGNITVGASYPLVDDKIKIAGRLEISTPGMQDSNSPSYYILKSGYVQWEVAPFISIG